MRRVDETAVEDERGGLFVADVRVDNCDELIAHFGWPGGEDRADADILHAAWQCWGEGLIERVLGDYAMAAWDGDELVLIRSPLGLKPLFYAVGPRWAAFASDPSALHRAGIVTKAPDLEFAARIIALEPAVGSPAIFAGISNGTASMPR